MYKTSAAVLPVSVDFTQELNVGEVVASLVGVTITPAGQLTVTGLAIASPAVNFNANSGFDGVNYLIQLVMLTDQNRTVTRDVFIAVQDVVPTPVESPDSYRTIIDELYAGESTKALATFVLDDSPDVTGAQGTWEVVDSEGIVYSSAPVIEIRSQALTNIGLRVEMMGVVNVPSNIPPSLVGTKYQLRWTLTLADGSTRKLFDNFTVKSQVQAPNYGAQNMVEVAQANTVFGINLSQKFDHVQFQLFSEGGKDLSNVVVAGNYQPTHSGHYFYSTVDTSVIVPGLEPFIVMWTYWSDSNPAMKYTDSAQLYLINPLLASVMSDLRSFVNKANEDDFVAPADLMSYLRTGMDEFNAYGYITDFNMTGARGAIRAGWLLFAQVRLLRARYLEEGAKSFEFGGAAVQLSQDRTSFLETIASSLEGQIDNSVRDFKFQLSMRGNTSGDGSSTAFVPGTAARLGITINPLSRYGVRSFSRIFLLGR